MELTRILASMTQNATQGDNTHPVTTNLSTEKGFFSVWEKLAARDPKFGHPEKFDTNVETARATAPTSSPRAARITPSWDSMWSWTATWCSPWRPVCAPP